MPRTKTIDGIIAEAQQILRVFAANEGFKVGDITQASLTAAVDALKAKSGVTEDLRTQLTAAVNDGNQQAATLTNLSARARAGIGAAFGLDSSEYEQAGGTRQSERGTRKPGTPKTPSKG